MNGTLVSFNEAPIIPKDGITVLVRDNVVYHSWGDKNKFAKLGDLNNFIDSGNIINSDRLFNFPKDTSIFDTLDNSSCLNRFLIINTQSNRTREQKIRNLIGDGKFITCDTGSMKFHVFLEDGEFKCSSNTRKKSHFSNFDSNVKFYVFDNIYDLGAWICNTR